MTKVDISGAGKDVSPSALLGCFSHNNPSSTVLLATGSPASPGFTEALFEDGAGALLSRASIGEGTSTKQEHEEHVGGGKDGPAHVVGPGELGLRGLEKDYSVDDEKQQEEEEERLVKRLKAEKGQGEAGMTIAERLKVLSEAIDQEAEGERQRAGGFKDGKGVLVPLGEEGVLQPQVESLSTVLTQALQSGDESLLEQCLAVGDQGVIKATAERLPSSKVLQFLLR